MCELNLAVVSLVDGEGSKVVYCGDIKRQTVRLALGKSIDRVTLHENIEPMMCAT